MTFLPGIVIKKQGWPVVSNPQAIDFRSRTLFDVIQTPSLDAAVEWSLVSLAAGGGGGGGPMKGDIYYLDHAPASPGDNHNDGDYTYDTSQKPYKVYRQVYGRWVLFSIRGLEVTYSDRDPYGDGSDNGNEGDIWINGSTSPKKIYVQRNGTWNTIIGDLWEASSSGISGFQMPRCRMFAKTVSLVYSLHTTSYSDTPKVWVSTDTGLTWSALDVEAFVGEFEYYISAIGLGLNNRLFILQSNNNYIFSSIDNFVSDITVCCIPELYHIFSGGPLAIACDGTYLYLACAYSSEYDHTDYDPDSGEYIDIYYPANHIIYRSSGNGGGSQFAGMPAPGDWVLIDNGITEDSYEGHSLSVANGRVYFSAWNNLVGDRPGYLYYLTTGETTWTPCSRNGGGIMPYFEKIIYTGTRYLGAVRAQENGSPKGIWSSNDGQTWAPYDLEEYAVYDLIQQGDTILAALGTSGVMKSTDDGYTWVDDTRNISAGDDVRAFGFAGDGDTILAAAGNIYRKSYPA